MESLYFWCAAIGGAILILQTLLLLIGHSGAGDADAGGHLDLDGADGVDGTESHAFFKVLTLQTAVAFLTFFGLSGTLCLRQGLADHWTLIIAVLSGSVAFSIVAYLTSLLVRLESKGNVDLQNSVGQVARVYLRIPGQHQGHGKVTLTIQGRTVECKAVTAGAEIPTGSEVQVIGTRTGHTVEVMPAQEI
jgi:hypothetical protein